MGYDKTICSAIGAKGAAGEAFDYGWCGYMDGNSIQTLPAKMSESDRSQRTLQ